MCLDFTPLGSHASRHFGGCVATRLVYCLHWGDRMTRKRTTLYAAFNGAGMLVINVWHYDRKRLELLIADRKANGDAFWGEHPVRIYVAHYNRLLAAMGLPPVRE